LTISLDMSNDRDGGLSLEGETVNSTLTPFYSYDGVTWTPVTGTLSWSNPYKSFTVPNSGNCTSNSIYIAALPPYSFTKLEADISTWVATGNLSSEDLGDSDGGRSIYHLTIGSGPVVMTITSRAHPREPNANWMLKGMLDFLTSGDSHAVWLRSHCTIHVFPMINVDGVYAGRVRSLNNGEDANRDYDPAGPDNTDEEDSTFLIHTEYDTFESTVKMNLDMHGGYQDDPTLYREAGSFTAALETAIESHISTYDGTGYLPTTFSDSSNPGDTVNTTWREGLLDQYGIDVLLNEGGYFESSGTGYLEVSDWEPMGEALIEAVLEGLIDVYSINDFSNDSSVYGVYNFESGALTDDSSAQGTAQDFTASANAPDSDTSNYKQGAGSADYDDSVPEYHYRTDANLATGHPFKSSTGEHDFSVCYWVRKNSGNTGTTYAVSKYDTNSERTYGHAFLDSDYLVIIHGYNSGDSFGYAINTEHAFVTDRWYWIFATYTASTDVHTVKVWDDNSGSYVVDTSGDSSSEGDMTVGSAPFAVGGRFATGSAAGSFDGKVDELVVFDRVISETEADYIRTHRYNETYP